MKRTLIVAALLIAAAIVAPVVIAKQPADLHCPTGNKVQATFDGELDDIVLAEGTMLCVKAGPGNTGVVEADGVTTLQDYLKEAGIVGGDGEGRNVSYYVTYSDSTPSPTPTPTPTPVEPTPTPTPTPTPEEPTPSPSPTPTASPTPSPTPTAPPPVTETPTPRPTPTLPDTATKG